MKKNIINLPAVRTGTGLAVRDVDDPDLMVNLVERHPGHIQRRANKRAAYKRALIRAENDRDQQMRDLTLLGQFTTLGVVVVMGLML